MVVTKNRIILYLDLETEIIHKRTILYYYMIFREIWSDIQVDHLTL